MKQSKNSSHADKIARRNVEFKINVQIIALDVLPALISGPATFVKG